MKILRTKRKTIALIIETDGSLTVRAPLHVSQAEIERIVHSKAAWIREQQAEMRRIAPPQTIQPGGQAWFMGQQFPIEIHPASRPVIQLQQDCFIVAAAGQDRLADIFKSWYRQAARKVIGERLAQLAKAYGLRYTGIQITSARSRWGSCSSKGSLNFSWRLVQAPPEIIDSVILHELAHLKIRNHSPAFYTALSQLDPAWKVHRDWLKQHAAELMRN